MRVPWRSTWTRQSEAGRQIEFFLVAGVASVLLLRWFLALAGYPRIGGAGLHVAHLLWGGLFMLVALLLLLTFLDRPVHRAAAGIGGIGFGVFIDEVGKFVTADNDYFYRPAIALIYAVFVGLFLILRAVLEAPRLSTREALANAIHLSEAGVGGSISPAVRQEILALLAAADPGNPLTRDVGDYVARLQPEREPTDVIADERHVEQLVDRLVANAWFDRAFVLFVAAYAVGSVLSTVLLGAIAGGTGEPAGLASTGETASSLVGAGLVLFGLARWPTSPALRLLRVTAGGHRGARPGSARLRHPAPAARQRAGPSRRLSGRCFPGARWLNTTLSCRLGGYARAGTTTARVVRFLGWGHPREGPGELGRPLPASAEFAPAQRCDRVVPRADSTAPARTSPFDFSPMVVVFVLASFSRRFAPEESTTATSSNGDGVRTSTGPLLPLTGAPARRTIQYIASTRY
jgi:hypothetical protein